MKALNKLLIIFAITVFGSYFLAVNWHGIGRGAGGPGEIFVAFYYLIYLVLVEYLHLDIIIVASGFYYLIYKGQKAGINRLFLLMQIIALLLCSYTSFNRFVEDFSYSTMSSGKHNDRVTPTAEYGILSDPGHSAGNFVKYMCRVPVKAYNDWDAGIYASRSKGHTIYTYHPGLTFKFYILSTAFLVHLSLICFRRLKSEGQSEEPD